MNDNEYIQLNKLILKSLEGECTQKEFLLLDRKLATDPEAARYYNWVIAMYTVMDDERSEAQLTKHLFEETQHDHAMLHILAEEEKNAPAIEVPKTQERQLIQKVVYPPREKQKVSKLTIFTFANIAAVILLFIILKFAPSKAGFEVATLTESIDAKWADITDPMEKGTRIVTGNERLLLREGYAELLFDTNARVVIEAPAEFQILAEDRIGLNYGKIYSRVPKEAIGFSVYTKNAKIVDMGTEFGIDVDTSGNTQLHVLEGKTMLIAGQQSSKTSIEVTKGQAKKVSGSSSSITDISCDLQLFVRHIDSRVGLVWKGQRSINLADIVGGGNGFGNGILNDGIEISTGKTMSRLSYTGFLPGAEDYKPVQDSVYIDGVFCPGVQDGKTQISSDGSCHVQFMKTSGNFWGYICNGAWHESDVPRHALELHGITFGDRANPAIGMHSNQGITFDLNAIRKNLPIRKITAFRCLAGVSETTQDYIDRASISQFVNPETTSNVPFPAVEFWVFIDGKKMFAEKISKAVQIDIPITAKDRFLTVAVSESDDSMAFDWALLGQPELIIEVAD